MRKNHPINRQKKNFFPVDKVVLFMWLNNELNIYWNFHQAKFSKAFHIASVKPVVLLFSCVVFTVFTLPVIKLLFLV